MLTTSANDSNALRLTRDAAIPAFYISQSSKSPLIPSIKLQAPLHGALIPFVLYTVKTTFKASHIT